MLWAILSTILFAISCAWAWYELGFTELRPQGYVAVFAVVFLAMACGEAWEKWS